MYSKRWLLPEGVDELLPKQAAAFEQLRRKLLDMYASWGYQLVIPPLVEYLESLLSGTGQDLALQTIKLTDQMSGHLLGIRADITPQAARIDSHQLQQQVPTRLCYIGSVFRAQPDSYNGSRSPVQIGAELYGHSGIESDFEILHLMLVTLQLAGLENVHLDLGHVGIYRALAEQAGLDQQQESTLFEALQRKAKPEIAALLDSYQVSDTSKCMLQALADLNGGSEVLQNAYQVLDDAPGGVHDAIAYLQGLEQKLSELLPQVPVHYDLAELRAYHYQTGVVYAAFLPGQGNEIARGGRYDQIGAAFGRARPATGFSADLKTLMALGSSNYEPVGAILAPMDDDPALRSKVAELRAAGRSVIQELPGQVGEMAELGVYEKLVKTNQGWVLQATG
jgi:ATP phosphoribosyltransferase regulatory subunit